MYTIYVIFVVAASVLLVGLVKIIFSQWDPPEFFFLAFGIVIGEPIGLFIFWAKNIFGLRTNIKERTYSNEEEVRNYMKELISSGSTLDILSGRLHWVSEDESVKERLIERARSADINIYLPRENQIARELRENGVKIHINPTLGKAPHARFTLVDKDRPGATMLAIASGRFPELTISEFYEKSHPQVVALARDHVNGLRGQKNAR